MKKIITAIVILAIIAILIIYKVTLDKKEKSDTAIAVPSKIVPADAFLVRDTTIEYQISTIGTIRANESVEIVSEISKKIVGIFLKEGSFVSKGQLLFKLDDADIVAKMEKLKLDEQLAMANESRERALLTKGGISQQKYDEVLNLLKTIQAEIDYLEVELSKTELIAPFSGKIGLRNVSIGAYVSPNVILANLQDISKIKIDFTIPEKYATDIKPGQVISFKTDYSPETFIAKVEATEPSVDLKTRTIQIRAIIDNRNNLLVPGSSVKVNLNLKELSKSIFVPTEALIPSLKGYGVYLYKNGKAVLTICKLGIRTKSAVQVLEGMNVGDTLITTNLLSIKPNSPVKIITLE